MQRLGERRFTAAALASLLVIASCLAEEVTEPQGGQATLSVTADVSATAAATLVVEVTGPGITTPLVFNLEINTLGIATGLITIPAGSGRVITMRAFDVNGVQTHQGSVTINIGAGPNPPISLVLIPLIGDVPITVTLGRITVTVTRSPASVGVGLTLTLEATIRDANGDPIVGPVTWATRDPGVASVTSSGVVTGVAPGETKIVASYQGAAGSSTVTVVAAWPNEPGLPLLTDNPWNSLTAPGWRWRRINGNKDADIVVDGTIPFSPPYAARHIFTAGMAAGEAPQVFWYAVYGAGYREAYFAWWFKYSANFPVATQGLTKLTYIFLSDAIGGTPGSAWTAVVGPDPLVLTGGPPYYLGLHIQWPPYGPEQTLLPNVTATPIREDEWHLVEWYVKFPSVPGTTSDGIVRIWVDGEKNHDRTNIQMPAGAAEFGEFDHEPVPQIVMPAYESYLYIDHTRITAR